METEVTIMKKSTAPLSAQRTIRIAAFALLAITAAATSSLLIWSDPPAGDPRVGVRTMPSAAGWTDPLTPAGNRTASTSGGETSGTTWTMHSGTATGTGGTPSQPADAEQTRPRYADEVSLLLTRIETVREVLASSRFHPGVYEVDAANPTSMVVLADTRERAENLDGFFRLGVDLDGETWGNAPLALGLSKLYTETGRDRAFADGSFCSDGLDRLLGDALASMLGDGFEPGMLEFILEEYREGMETRVLSDGPGRTGYRAVATFSAWDVVFNDGYVTFVEFYPVSSPFKP